MNTQPPTPTYRRLFALPSWRRIWLGSVLSFGGDALSRIALPVYVFQLTENAAALGGAFALQRLPWIILGPFAGVLADRFNRKLLLVATLLLEAVSIGLVGISTSLWHVYVLTLVATSARVVRDPVWTAALPDMIGTHLYSRALTTWMITSQVMDTAGIAIGGIVVVLIGPQWTLFLDSSTFVANAVMVATIAVPQPLAKPIELGRLRHDVWMDIHEGLRFIRTSAPLGFLVAIMGLRGATVISVLPILLAFAEDDLRAGAFVFGLLSAAAGLGFVLSSVLAVRLESTVTPFKLLVWGSTAAGLLLLPFLLVRSLLPLIVLFWLSALAYGAGNVVANVCIVKLAPTELRGRVDATSWSLIILAQMIGSVLLGLLGSLLGAGLTIGMAGLVLTIGCLTIAWRSTADVRASLDVVTIKKENNTIS